MSDKPLAVALVCFDGEKTAGAARRPFESKLRSNGDVVLETTILRVNGNHKASVHDPRRVVAGTLTPALTWGLFGLIAGTDKVESTIIWAVLGAICGALYAYGSEHLLTKSDLTRIGKRLAAGSSALLTYVLTSDPQRLLGSSDAAGPSAASVAAIDPDLTARAFAGSEYPVEVPHGSSTRVAGVDETSLLSMILVRYDDAKAAARVAAGVSKAAHSGPTVPQVELVIETDPDGRRRVTDPTHGTAAMSRSDVVSWGGFGLVFGAIVGAIGGGGILGFLKEGLATGVAWAIFGLAAGALYGLWAGRSISARRLRGIGPLLAPSSSTLLAWAEGPLRQSAVDALEEPGAKRLILLFNPIKGGAVLEAT